MKDASIQEGRMRKIVKLIVVMFYLVCAKQMPVSSYPFGKLGRYLRFVCARYLFKSCGKNVNIEGGADFGYGNLISIGDNSGIGVNAWIRAEIEIGKNVMMGPYVIIYGRDHNFQDINKPMNSQGMSSYSKIVIEDDVWIGSRATILKGVTVAQGSIIAAGSVVVKNVEAYTVVGGNPAKVIGRRIAGE